MTIYPKLYFYLKIDRTRTFIKINTMQNYSSATHSFKTLTNSANPTANWMLDQACS